MEHCTIAAAAGQSGGGPDLDLPGARENPGECRQRVRDTTITKEGPAPKRARLDSSSGQGGQ